MPEIQVQDESRKNPYITTGINKKFLTPCRQVGLSRKRKTPTPSSASLAAASLNTPPSLSTSLNSSLDSANMSCCRVGLSKKRRTPSSVNNSPFASSVNTLPSLETTPLSSSLESHNVKDEPQNNVETEKKKKKGKVSKCLMEEDDFVSDSDLGNCSKKKCINTEPIVLSEVEESSKSSLSAEETLNKREKSSDLAETENKSEGKSKIGQKNRLKNRGDNTEELNQTKLDKCGGKDININQSEYFEQIASPMKTKSSEKAKPKKKKIIIDSSDDEEVPLSNLKLQMIEEVKTDYNQLVTVKIVTTKETENDSVYANYNFDKHRSLETEKNKLDEENGNTKKYKVSENTTPTTLENLAKSAHKEQKSTKIKRCLSLKKSSGDFKNDGIDYTTLTACSVSLNPLESTNQNGNETKSFPSVSATEVKDIEKLVRDKRKLVEELKRAEIYQKKHDLKALEAVTSRWKEGCISALNDLLPGLQTHASIDMATLLRNLNIPKEMITLSEDGQLM